ncbi:hypothetical protein DFA_04590 [Cavenderia fasciculata]|uniref:Uncharacterized protein n=1 Tax=Cavenderia fasciculata TaxID=261658 RepID=F4PQ00_CACFS|nr:uncharacterized protein DFA_04590 [Cavenderia fasciculata]EGG22463.1 hypothetical protein DFA_04590 [Cavenderia fasciculata]|eukprot:XP_004360314.1 hypothetical protein DFA_04590 [Cavenderia fasciculata]
MSQYDKEIYENGYTYSCAECTNNHPCFSGLGVFNGNGLPYEAYLRAKNRNEELRERIKQIHFETSPKHRKQSSSSLSLDQQKYVNGSSSSSSSSSSSDYSKKPYNQTPRQFGPNSSGYDQSLYKRDNIWDTANRETLNKLARDVAHQKAESADDWNKSLNARLLADDHATGKYGATDARHVKAQEYAEKKMYQADPNHTYKPNYNPTTDNPVRNDPSYDHGNHWDQLSAHVYDTLHQFDGITYDTNESKDDNK